MLTKKILLLGLITSILIHAAADEAKVCKISDFVGSACSSRGNLARVITIEPEEGPFCSVTLVYSEHEILITDDKLLHIANVIDRDKKLNDSEHFKKLCMRATAAHVIPIRSEPVSNNFSMPDKRQPFLIALCINLTSKYVEYIGCFTDRDGREMCSQDKIPFLQPKYNGLLATCITATSHIPHTSTEPAHFPKTVAQRLQTEHPNHPFRLVIDLALWRAALKDMHTEEL